MPEHKELYAIMKHNMHHDSKQQLTPKHCPDRHVGNKPLGAHMIMSEHGFWIQKNFQKPMLIALANIRPCRMHPLPKTNCKEHTRLYQNMVSEFKRISNNQCSLPTFDFFECTHYRYPQGANQQKMSSNRAHHQETWLFISPRQHRPSDSNTPSLNIRDKGPINRTEWAFQEQCFDSRT